MAAAFRNPLGVGLQQSILPGDQPDYAQMPGGMGMSAPKKQGLFAPGSKGQMIAGIIADALAGATGRAPVFGQMMQQQRQQQAEEAQWTRRRQIERQQGREDKVWERDNLPSQGDSLERALKASGVLPGTPKWVEAMGRRADNLLNPMMAVQTVDANGNPAITYTPRNPTGQTGGNTASVPTVSDEAGYNALPAGAQYRDPSGHLRTKAGGPGATPASFPGGGY